MVEGVPEVFRSGGGNAVASYDYTEIASGLGYVEFTCATSSPAGTLTYHLTDKAFEVGYTNPSSVVNYERAFNILYPTTGRNVTLDFVSSPFSLARTLKGKCFIQFTITNSAGSTGTLTPTISLLVNSTVVGTTTGAVSSPDPSVIKTYCVSFDLTQTVVKKGDTLTLRINATTASDVNYYLYHDPLNRSHAGYTPLGKSAVPTIDATQNQTKLTALIPFRIDL
jgi:hypothetical protein